MSAALCHPLLRARCCSIGRSLNRWALCLQDMQRPLYMQPLDAIEYGVIDGIVTSEKEIIDEVKSADQWDKEAGLVRA